MCNVYVDTWVLEASRQSTQDLSHDLFTHTWSIQVGLIGADAAYLRHDTQQWWVPLCRNRKLELLCSRQTMFWTSMKLNRPYTLEKLFMSLVLSVWNAFELTWRGKVKVLPSTPVSNLGNRRVLNRHPDDDAHANQWMRIRIWSFLEELSKNKNFLNFLLQLMNVVTCSSFYVTSSRRFSGLLKTNGFNWD